MSFANILAVGIGAAIGAWLRWILNINFSESMFAFPLGTLISNLVGGLLMGLALGIFTLGFVANQEARLFITTGLLGGLTTFSTFSAEAVALIEKKQLDILFLHLSSHVLGSIMMTMIGIKLAQLIFK